MRGHKFLGSFEDEALRYRWQVWYSESGVYINSLLKLCKNAGTPEILRFCMCNDLGVFNRVALRPGGFKRKMAVDLIFII